MRLVLFLATSLLCASCDRPAIDASQSLVGAKQLPSAKVLSREMIEINRAFFEPGPRLIFHLLPNNSLTITLTDWDRQGRGQVIEGKESVQISSDAAVQLRRLLWRVRPEKLQGMGSVTEPDGCPQPPTDELPKFTVGFIAEGPKPGSDDDKVGIFALFPSCRTKKATQAHDLLLNVVAKFPHSNIPAEYNRRVQLLKDQLSAP